MVSLRNKKNYPELSSNTLSYLELWGRMKSTKYIVSCQEIDTITLLH